ncbi:hypothetical protein KEM56_005879 [Ascosphaera pollenicola]|nr:hypothetical protein KEM56_005879 [Ascosphaera pollenicola]
MTDFTSTLVTAAIIIFRVHGHDKPNAEGIGSERIVRDTATRWTDRNMCGHNGDINEILADISRSGLDLDECLKKEAQHVFRYVSRDAMKATICKEASEASLKTDILLGYVCVPLSIIQRSDSDEYSARLVKYTDTETNIIVIQMPGTVHEAAVTRLQKIIEESLWVCMGSSPLAVQFLAFFGSFACGVFAGLCVPSMNLDVTSDDSFSSPAAESSR